MAKKDKKKPAAKKGKPANAGVHIKVTDESAPVMPTPPPPPAPPAAKPTPPPMESPKPSGPQATIVKKEPIKGRPPTKLWILIAVAGLVLIGGATWVGLKIFQPSDGSSVHANANVAPDANGLVPRKLDGVMVQPEQSNPNIYAVMIENLTGSRPPSGLDKASVVYEALAEGGITRFMALFPVGTEVPEIGPVRSARRYYISYAEEYNKPLYIHAGGSPDALSYLKTSSANVIDFNQFFHAPNFWRDSSRSAPHNLYTSTEKLFLGLKAVAPDAEPAYDSWPYKDPAELTTRQAPTAATVVIDYSSFNYRVTYKYQPELNVYFRSLGDSDHVTRAGDKIAPTNVVVMYVEAGLLPGETQRLQMQTEGTGRALVFRDGQVIEGTWKKDSGQGRTTFLDANGQPIELDRGMTWLSIIPPDRDVTYSPPESETTN